MIADWEHIIATVRWRQLNRSPLIDAMLQVRQRYNAEWVLPYPGREDAPDLPAVTPLLIADSIDFQGQRAGGVMPHITSPALDFSRQDGPKSREYADVRRMTIDAIWRKSRARNQLRRAYRHLSGYASTALSVSIDYELEQPLPVFMARDPLACYPEEKAPEDLTPIANCAFVYGKSRDWIRKNYPESRIENGGPVPEAPPARGEDYLWDVVEWVDEDQCVFGILGPRDWVDGKRTEDVRPGDVAYNGMLLRRYPNYAGMCTIVAPRAITLDRTFAAVQALVGTVDIYGRLQALAISATEKSIFPDTYLLGNGFAAPTLVDGVWHDGRTGKVNLVKDATAVGQLRSTPDPTNQANLDRLERNFRVSTGLVPQAGGESYGALRTGRANDSMLAAAVDPRIAELHDTLTPDLERVNEIALALMANTPCCQRKYVLFCGTGESGMVEVEPKHLETTENSVTYAIPGADAQSVTINLGQMVGAHLLSAATAQELHPWIQNPAMERRRIVEETLEEAMLTGIAQKAQTGELPLEMIAEIEEAARANPDIIAAFKAANEKVRAAQAAEVPPTPEPLPAMQPGMEGMAAPEGQMPVPPPLPNAGPPPGQMGPSENQKGLAALLQALSQQPTEGAETPMPVT